MGSSSGQSGSSYDLSFKVLLIGDSGVGKSSLLLSFISTSAENLAPTIGTFCFPLTKPNPTFFLIIKEVLFLLIICLVVQKTHAHVLLFLYFDLFSFLLGVDFKIKLLKVGGKRLKLTIWDTGNEIAAKGFFYLPFLVQIMELFLFCSPV